ncbi:hypothetical protein NAT51_15335 [Flavobacterium amniphilum]|uniref:hypothetical protein n=1 Tax=Flavobacterium amniphilum TaxID=1834035 RepID=UPI002029CD89|nr:hypothetical protein [Flavobacterium amniphilum]MCL9806908.1 hypothetical protein [Flavobacterium amniphilum]
MIQRTRFSRAIATFFLLVFVPSLFPVNLLYASNNGPNAPEASGFESANATDMVNLATGDLSYVLPLMDVGGMPISMSYHGGIPLDLESTWTGLGWNLNTGAINRGLNATPDDWRGGSSLDFIRYEDAETIYNIDVGIGLKNGAEVGVGASWGSNKSLTGSVFASVGLGNGMGASARIYTDGNYSLGVNAGAGNGQTGFGGSMGISGNVNGGGLSYNVGAGLRTGGMTIGVGASFSENGTQYSASLGGGNDKGQSGSMSLSTGSFSVGDWEVKSSGFYIPIQLPGFSIGFGKTKVTTSLTKAYTKKGFGVLYGNVDASDSGNDAVELNSSTVDGVYSDYQDRYRYIDTYDQALPVSEEEFIGDYDMDREKINFTYAGYDSYDVNGAGISGSMAPKMLDNATIYGLGYHGPNPGSFDGKMRIYNHNSLTTTKTFGKNTSNDIEFYFNGQFTQNRNVNSLTIANNGGNSLGEILSTRPALNNDRIKQGNYVEVFTNKQIKNNQAAGLLSPLSPTANGTSLDALLRNTPEYKDDGIGGYKITAPDGKVYHFSQPVYHFEMVERKVLKDNNENNVSEKRQYSSYATHWLLTAITGPDFIDTNNNNIADQEDYGYWVRMDYGKWSDGYVWRNPTDKNLKDYDSNLKEKIEKGDYGTYQFGRKQLYYLDRVVSATQTAYFVKDLRFDSSGCDLEYKFSPTKVFCDRGESNGPDPGNVYPHENGIAYKKQLQMVLEKIILVNNKESVVSKGNANDNLKLNTYGLPDYVKSYQPGFRGDIDVEDVFGQPGLLPAGGFYNEYGNPNIMINNESGVYDVKDFENFDYNNAVKVIDLDYNYNLAVKDHTNNYTAPTAGKSMGSPGAVYHATKNPNAGKLCLKSVRFLGRNNYDFMQPYQFEYKGEYKGDPNDYIKYPANAIVQREGLNWLSTLVQTETDGIPITDLRAKDEWGFHKDIPGQEDKVLAAAWTMNKITTPTGGTIEFEHEEDDFHSEAFSRKFWSENLKFKVTNSGDNLQVEITDESGTIGGLGTKYKDYFAIGDRVFLDLWLCRNERHWNGQGTDTDKGTIDINSGNKCIITEVSDTGIKLTCDKLPVQYTEIIPGIPVESGGTLYGDNKNLVLNNFFSKTSTTSNSHHSEPRPRGECPDLPGCGTGCPDRWSIKYRMIASKTPKDRTGGGLRVKSITLKDEANNSYKTRYYYNVPGYGREKTDANYKSSGITSFSPVRGQKFVPYQSELPSPGVMYEYVTMEAQDVNGKSDGSTLYRFYTLKPVMDIFNPNIVMKDDDDKMIFKATVVDNGEINASRKLNAKSINVEVNTSVIGQFRSVEEYNTKGQLMSRVEKKYLSGTELESANINRGAVKESFQSMKSVYTAPAESPNNLTLKTRLLSVSSKKEYGSVLVSTTNTNMHGTSTETYSDTDPETGMFLTVETTNAKGLKQKVTRVPAYKKYAEMGSKTVNPNNKHMLTQEVMNTVSIDGKTTGVGITTWNKNWTYRDNFGVEATPTANNEKVWRKQKGYVWKGIRNSDGTYVSSFSEAIAPFDWINNVPLSPSWKKVSEVTRYNHYSSPIETKDINGNFASTKMADKQDKVIVSGNARYSEMYYSGAEYVESGNMFEGEVKGATLRSTDVAHTGKYSVKSSVVGEKMFEVNGSSGPKNYYANINNNYAYTFRPGKYKVSYWVLKNFMTETCRTTGTNNYGTMLVVNGTGMAPSEIVHSGCWAQLNFVFDIPENTASNSVHVKMTGGSCGMGAAYVDDFRMSPLTSSLNSYVYDQKTDQLICVLGTNNMGTIYKYDNAGRLIATYTEDVDTDGKTYESGNGGFKLINQNKQNYKGISNTQQALPFKIDNCFFH